MFKSDDKIVSISFDNKQFLNDVSTTIKALENLNDITSGKTLKTTGISNLESAFDNLNKNATRNMDAINNSVSDTTAYSKLSDGVNDAAHEFSLLEGIAVGAMLSIGNAAFDAALHGIQALTSGIRDGWGEYNLLIDSTQTILANTERYGTTIGDVTKSLDELNDYADLTIYNFAQMTRNMGYFTTSGMDLESAQTMVMGMANLAALFGASNESLQRAMYQTSQAMSAGLIRKMDWKSLQNATMSGTLFQEELIRVAAFMTGKPYENMKEWVDRMGGFYESLDQGWLTSEIMEETMRRFAGMTREELAALQDINGNGISDEEIERIVQLGEKGIEAAQVVRTLKQMLESLGESIGSGWTETFRLVIGDLEEAKKFWSPINKILTTTIGNVGNYRNAILQAWHDAYRPKMIDDMAEAFRNLTEVFEAIALGVNRAFGDPKQIGRNIGVITEALGDLAHSMALDEDELSDITDLVEGLVSPLKILGDIITEFVTTFFDAGQTMDIFATRTDSTIDKLKPLRKIIIDILGTFGRYLTAATNFVRSTGIIQKSFNLLFNTLKLSYNILNKTFGAIFGLLSGLWNKYDLTNKLLYFANVAYAAIMGLEQPLRTIYSLSRVIFSEMIAGLSAIDFTPIMDFKNILKAIRDLLVALFDPTKSVTDAIANLRKVFINTSINKALLVIKRSVISFINVVKTSGLEPYINAIIAIGEKAFTIFKYGIGAIILGVMKLSSIFNKTKLKEYLENIGDAIVSIYNKIKSTNFGSFILDLASRIQGAIHSLISVLRGDEIESTATTFIENVKNVLATKDELPSPNVFTVIKGMSDGIKDVTSSLANPKEYGPIKDALDNIKDVANKTIEVIRDGKLFDVSTKDTNRFPRFFEVVRDVVVNVGERVGEIGSSAYNALKTRLQSFSDALSLLASGERYRDLDNAHKFADIIEMFNSVFTRIASSIIIFMHILSVLKIAVAIKAVSEMVSSVAGAAKRMATAQIFKSISKMFLSFALIAAVFIGGAFLISKYADLSKFDAVFNKFTKNLMMVFGTILVGTAIITLIATKTAVVSKTMKSQASDILKSVARLMNSIGRVMLIFVAFIGIISYVALQVSAMSEEQQAAFKNTVNLLSETFVKMLLMFSAIVLIGTLCGNVAKTLSSVSGDILLNNSSLFAVGSAFSSMALAISVFVLSIGAAMAAMLYLSPSTEKLTKVGDILKDFMWAFIALISVILLFTTLAGPTMAVDIAAVSAMIRTMAGAFIGVMLSVAVLASVVNLIMTSMSTITTVMAGISDPEKVEKIKDSIMSMFMVVAIVVAGCGLFTMFVGMFASMNLLSTNAMLAFAGSVFLLTVGLIAAIQVISSCIIALDKISGPNNVDTIMHNIMDILLSIGIFMAVTALAVTAIGVAASKLPGLAGGMIAAAASVLLIVTAIAGMALTLGSLAMIDIAKLDEALSVINIMVITIGALLAGLSILGMAGGGIGAVALLLAAISIYTFAEAMMVLSKTMHVASSALSVFAFSLDLLSKVDMTKVTNNVMELIHILPKALEFLVNNADKLQRSLTIIFRLLGVAMAEGIWMFVNTSITLITAGVAGLIEGLAAPFLGILYSIMDIIIGFLKKELGEGGQIRNLIVILEEFLVWAAEDIGYYGLLIGVALLEGVASAILYEGWDLKIGAALYTIWVGIKKILLDKIGFNDFQSGMRIFGFNLLADIAIGFLDAVGIIEFILGRVFEIIEEFIHDAVGDDIWNALVSANIFGASQVADNVADAIQGVSNEWQAFRDARTLEIVQEMVDDTEEGLENLDLMNAQLDDWITSRRPGEFETSVEGGTESLSTLSEFAQQAKDALSSLGTTMRDALGIPEGGLMSLLTDSLGLDNFSLFGEGAGTDWMNGFTDAMNASSEDLIKPEEWNTGSLANMEMPEGIDTWGDPDKIEAFNEALGNTPELPEEFNNPVVTPVWDDTELRAGAEDTWSWWQNKNFDEFAVDAGNSMLLREQTDGNAATDGEVSVSYTQINNYPPDKSPIQIYRDTRNLIRGSGSWQINT